MSHSSPIVYAVAGDHAGYPLKKVVAELLVAQQVEIIDCGAHDETSSDYPDFAVAVGEAIRSGKAQRAILCCGSGVGVSVAANKIPGIRAALCHDPYSARQGVEHDDMNVLCIGGRVIGPELAFECIRAFMGATYSPSERHARRLEKVMDIERKYLRDPN